MLEVVSGVIIKNRKIFLAQRPPDKSCPFRWETPGGKVEGNESHHSALRRELMEELAIDAKHISEQVLFCEKFYFEPAKDDVLLMMYRVHEYTGTPQSMEGQGFGWFQAKDLVNLDLVPGCQLALKTLIRALS